MIDDTFPTRLQFRHTPQSQRTPSTEKVIENNANSIQ